MWKFASTNQRHATRRVRSRGAPRSHTLELGFTLILVGAFLSGCTLPRPSSGSVTKQIGEVCLYQQVGGPWHAQVRTKGCYSTTCTQQLQKVGSLVIDRERSSLHFTASWLLAETSGFPLGCSDDCMGGGTVDFYIDELEVGDWTVSVDENELGVVIIPSGRLIERQCLSS